ALFDVDADEVDDEHWAPVAAELKPQPQPEPVVAAQEPEPEPEVVTLWAPTPEPEPEAEPEAPAVDPDAIEVVEVVSANRRRLARSGSR
ncbi:MAG: hypothetical protein M3163_09210, partial [Actinomycetota bacterium]|nr:hypothetical protein [Actinomycetota bacterium]